MPVIRVADIKKDFRISFTTAPLRKIAEKKLDNKTIRNGDILVVKSSGSASSVVSGRAAIVEGVPERSYGFANFLLRLRVDPKLYDPYFLFYLLNSAPVREQVLRLIGSTTYPNIKVPRYRKIQIPLAPLPEQRRIVDILKRADGIRRLRKQAIQTARELIPALFVDIFGDPATNPKGWSIVPLSKLVREFRYGTSTKSSDHGYPTLRIPNVIAGEINITKMKQVPVTNSEYDRLRLEDGDILFVRTNGNPDYVGRCACFNRSHIARYGMDPAKFIYASYLIRARLDPKRVEPVYLQSYLSTSIARNHIRERSRTSAGQYNINTENLGTIPVLLPNIELQCEFVSRLRDIKSLAGQQMAGEEKAGLVFESLLHRAFRGDLQR